MIATTSQAVTYGHDAAMARFSVARYQRMIEVGILTSEDKVELLENYVVLKMPSNPPHDSTIQRMLEKLFPLRPAGWSWRVQYPSRCTTVSPNQTLHWCAVPRRTMKNG